jgi:nucleoside-diphosphate kinase
VKQRTCLLIKPDGIEKKVAGKVLDRFEREGFGLIALKMLPPDRKRVEEFYSLHRGKPFYDSFIDFMMEGPSIAMVWEGENAVDRTREIIGATHSKEARAGTLRNLYGTDNRRNLVHASDSEDSAEREIGILFAKEEILHSMIRN